MISNLGCVSSLPIPKNHSNGFSNQAQQQAPTNTQAFRPREERKRGGRRAGGKRGGVGAHPVHTGGLETELGEDVVVPLLGALGQRLGHPAIAAQDLALLVFGQTQPLLYTNADIILYLPPPLLVPLLTPLLQIC